jgi:hypothetical protein
MLRPTSSCLFTAFTRAWNGISYAG